MQSGRPGCRLRKRCDRRRGGRAIDRPASCPPCARRHCRGRPQCARKDDRRADPPSGAQGGPFASSNFPSGHVVYATTLFGTLAWFALARGRRGLFVAMLALVIGMGPFRIIDGAHWPSDVLAGYALGLAWAIVVLVLGTRWAAGEESSALPHEHDKRREPAGAARCHRAPLRPGENAAANVWMTSCMPIAASAGRLADDAGGRPL
ncbi:MAG: phosphatase PAP2 family protein [Solirubrobacteraceae bacterium]